jgi:hypothetical protein
MMNMWRSAVLALLVSAGVQAQTPEKPLCSAPEVITGLEAYDQYNELVCAGAKSLQSKQYKEAAAKFEAALKLDLYDVPNFQSLSRLALAYHLSGKKLLAEQYLTQSELALKVLVGELRCIENKEHVSLVYALGGKVIVSSAASEIAKRMCGGAYENYYQIRTLSGFLSDAALVKQFFEVKAKVHSKQ